MQKKNKALIFFSSLVTKLMKRRSAADADFSSHFDLDNLVRLASSLGKKRNKKREEGKKAGINKVSASVKPSGRKKREKLREEATAVNISSCRLKYVLTGYNLPTVSSARYL